jgi:hypothetical protein
LLKKEKELLYLHTYLGIACNSLTSKLPTLIRFSSYTALRRKQITSLCPAYRNVDREDAGICNITASPKRAIAMASLRVLPLFK